VAEAPQILPEKKEKEGEKEGSTLVKKEWCPRKTTLRDIRTLWHETHCVILDKGRRKKEKGGKWGGGDCLPFLTERVSRQTPLAAASAPRECESFGRALPCSGRKGKKRDGGGLRLSVLCLSMGERMKRG